MKTSIEQKIVIEKTTYKQAFLNCWKIYDMSNVFYTTPKLLQIGICLCDLCGKKNSIDFKVCKYCNNEIVIFRK